MWSPASASASGAKSAEAIGEPMTRTSGPVPRDFVVQAGAGDGDGTGGGGARQGHNRADRRREANSSRRIVSGVITGAHVIVYSRDADADRAFFRDVLEYPHVDAGGGWLIFKLPPGEVAVHPAEGAPVARAVPDVRRRERHRRATRRQGRQLRPGQRSGLGPADQHPAARRRANSACTSRGTRRRPSCSATPGAAATPRRPPAPPTARRPWRTAALGRADRVGIEHMGDHPAQRLIGVQRLVDDGVLGVFADVPEQFDGELQLVAVDGVGAVGEVVGEAGQHVDVVVADVDLQRAVGGGRADVVVGARSDRSWSCSSAR